MVVLATGERGGEYGAGLDSALASRPQEKSACGCSATCRKTTHHGSANGERRRCPAQRFGAGAGSSTRSSKIAEAAGVGNQGSSLARAIVTLVVSAASARASTKEPAAASTLTTTSTRGRSEKQAWRSRVARCSNPLAEGVSLRVGCLDATALRRRAITAYACLCRPVGGYTLLFAKLIT